MKTLKERDFRKILALATLFSGQSKLNCVKFPFRETFYFFVFESNDYVKLKFKILSNRF